MNHDHQKDPPARRLAQIIVASHDDTACTACLDQLEAYVSAQLAGENYLALFPAVAQHLDSCVLCAESYALLYEARLAESSAALPAVAAAAQPVRSAAMGLQELLRQVVDRTGTGLRLRLTQALLDALPAAQLPAPALRNGTPSSTPSIDLALDDPEAAVTRLHLRVHPAKDTPERCTVRVQADVHGRTWPDLADVLVLLRYDGTQRQSLTDPWGEAVFDDVPTAALPNLQLEINAGTLPPTST